MGLGKQAKTLSKPQIKMLSELLINTRYGLRDQTIFYFSVKSGLRAKEIAMLKWSMVMNSDGSVGDYLHLPDSSSKGKSGRIVPLNKDLKKSLISLLEQHRQLQDFEPQTSSIFRTERSHSTSAQAVNAGLKLHQSPEQQCTIWQILVGVKVRHFSGCRFVHRPARRSAPTEQRSCAGLWSNRGAVFAL